MEFNITVFLILLLHLASCSFMTGVIWLIQLIHYPAFHKIENSHFLIFHKNHTTLMGYIVMPAMVVELITAILLILKSSNNLYFILNLFLLFIIWICTFVLSIPLHQQLSKNQNYLLIQKLVLTNWPRTLAWSLRLLIILFVSFKLFREAFCQFQVS